MKRPSLTFTPLYPEHLSKLRVHPVQTDEYNALLTDAGINSLANCTGVTAWAGGKPVALAGVYPLWQDRAEAWILAAVEARHYFLQALNKIRYVLDTVPFRRLEMTVKVNNDHGHKLARHLGFGGSGTFTLPNGKTVQADGLLQAYWPVGEHGTDVIMYSRIRKP